MKLLGNLPRSTLNDDLIIIHGEASSHCTVHAHEVLKTCVHRTRPLERGRVHGDTYRSYIGTGAATVGQLGLLGEAVLGMRSGVIASTELAIELRCGRLDERPLIFWMLVEWETVAMWPQTALEEGIDAVPEVLWRDGRGHVVRSLENKVHPLLGAHMLEHDGEVGKLVHSPAQLFSDEVTLEIEDVGVSSGFSMEKQVETELLHGRECRFLQVEEAGDTVLRARRSMGRVLGVELRSDEAGALGSGNVGGRSVLREVEGHTAETPCPFFRHPLLGELVDNAVLVQEAFLDLEDRDGHGVWHDGHATVNRSRSHRYCAHAWADAQVAVPVVGADHGAADRQPGRVTFEDLELHGLLLSSGWEVRNYMRCSSKRSLSSRSGKNRGPFFQTGPETQPKALAPMSR